MGQKANIITLQTKKFDLNLHTLNKKQFLYNYKYLIELKYLFKKKSIILDTVTLNFTNNKGILIFNAFFQTSKLLKFKNRLKNNILLKKNQNIFNNKHLNFLRINLIIFKLNILNKYKNTILLKFLYNTFKKYKSILFMRRINLFFDFLKLTSLFLENHIKLNTYLNILGQIFKNLSKRRHTRYIAFLKFIFKILIKNEYLKSLKLNLKGFKCILNGRLQGKTRANTMFLQLGMVNTQTINANVEFNCIHIYTLYGVFGLRIWISRY